MAINLWAWSSKAANYDFFYFHPACDHCCPTSKSNLAKALISRSTSSNWLEVGCFGIKFPLRFQQAHTTISEQFNIAAFSWYMLSHNSR